MMMMMSRTIYPVKLQQKVGFSNNTDKTRILRRGGGRRRPRFKSEEGEKGRGERRVLLLRTTTTTTSNSNSSIKDGAFKEEDKEEEEKPLLSGTAIKRIAGEDVDVSTEQKKLSREKARKKTKETVEFDANFCNVVTRYDPEAIRREALRRPAKLAKRVLFLTQKFSKLNGKRKELERIDRSTAEKSANGVTNDRLWAKEVKTTLTSLGPLFVKLGQNLANRPDLVPEDVMEELTTLQDKVPAFPTSEAREIMESQWGEKIDDVFETFTKEPVAAASIGQVYRGTLKKDKRDVAIKVLRPNTRDSVILDLFVLRAAAKQLFDNFCLENVGCPATLLVDEFAEKLLEELDFIQEGRNLRDFRNNFADDPSVHIPAVVPELSGPKVLVMDWQEGVRCTAPNAFGSDEAKRIFLQNGVESGLRQLLDFGLFHGDPHPGNVLALRDGDIAYVDFGNVAEISRSNQESLIDAVVHTMNRDYMQLSETLQTLGFLDKNKADIADVALGLQEVWGEDALEQLAGTNGFSFRGLTKEFNKLLFKYPIRVPERFSLVIRSLLTQESICLTLDPEFNFLDAAFPYVARRLLTDPDPALRLRLLKVIIVDGRFEWERLTAMIELAQVGAKGGVKLPMFSMAADAAIMLTKDKTLRTELAKGLRSVPVTEHIKRSFDFGQVIIKLVIAQIAGKAFRGFTFAFGGLFGMPKILFKFAFGKRKKLRTVMGCSLTEPEEGFSSFGDWVEFERSQGSGDDSASSAAAAA
mmetsp:Transcript_2517/g.9030  ORF Transcript_2517/g.9030 Transcript_2517/m.9030 type:complete len:753 (-) Transcript_2517:476-2734(-)